MKIKRLIERKIKTPFKKASASRKGKDGKSGDAAEEIFGVHIISSEDIENHFGASETESNGRTQQESAAPAKPKNKE